jgi:C4-type Zn-finger protein
MRMKPQIVCPNCLKGVEYKDYVQMQGYIGAGFTDVSNFIECRACGYYGLPIEIEKEKEEKKKEGKKKKSD